MTLTSATVRKICLVLFNQIIDRAYLKYGNRYSVYTSPQNEYGTYQTNSYDRMISEFRLPLELNKNQ